MSTDTKLDLIFDAAIKSWGSMTALLSLLGVFLAIFIIDKAASWNARWVLCIFILTFYIILVFARAFILAFERSNLIFPKVKIAKKPIGAFQDSYAILLTAPSPIFTYDSLVSVYLLETEMERLIGIGKVINIQIDKKIQIAIVADIGFGERWKIVCENGSDEIFRMIIKPFVPNNAMGEFNNGH